MSETATLPDAVVKADTPETKNDVAVVGALSAVVKALESFGKRLETLEKRQVEPYESTAAGEADPEADLVITEQPEKGAVKAIGEDISPGNFHKASVPATPAVRLVDSGIPDKWTLAAAAIRKARAVEGNSVYPAIDTMEETNVFITKMFKGEVAHTEV